MAKVICVTRDGRQHELTDSIKKCTEIFEDYLDALNPDRVKYWKEGWLYDDDGQLINHEKNMSQLEAIQWFEDIHKAVGRPWADDKEIVEATGLSEYLLDKITRAWLAFGLSERQGGCWIF